MTAFSTLVSRALVCAFGVWAQAAGLACVVPGGPVALTLGNGTHVVTVQFDGPQALALADVLKAAARRTKG